MEPHREQRELIQIGHDVRETRRSVQGIVSGLVSRGERLERLVDMSRDLSQFSDQLVAEARSRLESRKFRSVYLLTGLLVSSGLALLYFWTATQTPQIQQ